MSLQDLQRLRAHKAFTPAPLHVELSDVYILFDELSRSGKYDTALDLSVRSGQRVQIIAPSGAGKSSIIQYALGPAADGVLPVIIPVLLGDPDVATDPQAFIRHLLARIRREANTLAAHVGPSREQISETTTKITAGLTLPVGKIEAARDVKRVMEVEADSSTDRLEQLADVLQAIKAHQLVTVLVLDDTDKWLQSAIPDAAERRRALFFTQIPRLIAEHVNASLVMAVHPEYHSDPAYRSGREFLEEEIILPPLPTHEALVRVLRRRVAVALDDQGGSLAGRFTTAATELLFSHYQAHREPSIRGHIILNVHRALAHAIDADVDRVGEEHVAAAIAEETP